MVQIEGKTHVRFLFIFIYAYVFVLILSPFYITLINFLFFSSDEVLKVHNQEEKTNKQKRTIIQEGVSISVVFVCNVSGNFYRSWLSLDVGKNVLRIIIVLLSMLKRKAKLLSQLLQLDV